MGLHELRLAVGQAASVASVSAGRNEFAQLMSDHVFGNENGNVLLTVVDAERMPHEIGNDRRSSGPSLDELLFALIVQFEHLFEKVIVHEKSFL